MDINELIEKSLKGESTSQSELYNLMYSTIYNTCMRYAPTHHDGEDYMQECYTKVFNNLDTFIGDNMGELGAWVKRVCINHCIDQTRKFTPITTEIDGIDITNAETYDGEDKQFTLPQILYAIQQLSPRYKTIFNMFVLDGYSHNDITKELGLNPGTSKANLYKAKRKLKEILNTITTI